MVPKKGCGLKARESPGRMPLRYGLKVLTPTIRAAVPCLWGPVTAVPGRSSEPHANGWCGVMESGSGCSGVARAYEGYRCIRAYVKCMHEGCLMCFEVLGM